MLHKSVILGLLLTTTACGAASTPTGNGSPDEHILFIQQVVHASYSRVRACYEEGLARNPNLVGRVAVRVVIDGEGQVTSAEHDPGGAKDGDPSVRPLPDPRVATCVVDVFRTLTFPKPENGRPITAVYPVVFTSRDGKP